MNRAYVWSKPEPSVEDAHEDQIRRKGQFPSVLVGEDPEDDGAERRGHVALRARQEVELRRAQHPAPPGRQGHERLDLAHSHVPREAAREAREVV